MKNFIIKIFFFFCTVVFISAGMLFFMVYLGRLPLKDAIIFYNTLLQTPRHLDLLFGFATTFLCLGLISLSRVFRRTKQPNVLKVKDGREWVRIPVSTIRAFIIQIIGLNSHLNNIDITINKKGKWIFVNILCAYTGNMPVCQEMHKLKEVLRGEIKRVFEFPYLKINFQLDGINIDHTDNGSDDEIGQANQIEIEDEIEGEKVPEDEDLDTIPQPEGEPQDEDVIEDAVPPSAPKPKKRKGMPWER